MYLKYNYSVLSMHYIINWIKRLNGDYRRTTRIRGAFPKPDATIFLLRYVAMKLTIKSRKAQSRRDDIFVAKNAIPKPSSVGAKPNLSKKIRERDEMCRSYGAQLHHAITLLQRFSSSGATIKSRIHFRILFPFAMFYTSGATIKPHRGAPFAPDKSPVPSGRNLCSIECHTQPELRRSETKPI